MIEPAEWDFLIGFHIEVVVIPSNETPLGVCIKSDQGQQTVAVRKRIPGREFVLVSAVLEEICQAAKNQEDSEPTSEIILE